MDKNLFLSLVIPSLLRSSIKMCFISSNVFINIRGVIKKSVDWCDQFNTSKAMLTNFLGNIKQQIFYQLWKFKLVTLIINHFIITNNLYGMATWRHLRLFPWCSATSLFFSITLTLYFKTLLAKYTEVKYQLNHSFLHEYQIWRTVEWNWQCFQKGEFN